MQALGINISAVLPEVLLVLLAMLVMLVDAFAGKEENAAKNAIPWISLIGVVGVIFFALGQWGVAPLYFQSAAVTDHFTIGLRLIVLVTTGLSILVATPTFHASTSRQANIMRCCCSVPQA